MTYQKKKKKFRFSALQLSAFLILPLFTFVLIIKVEEKQENEILISKKIEAKNLKQQKYMISTVSQPLLQSFEEVTQLDSAK